MSTTQFFESPEQQSIIKTKLVAKYFGAWTKIMVPRAKGQGGTIDVPADKRQSGTAKRR